VVTNTSTNPVPNVSCNNGSSNCKFSLAVLGNSTGD
jgi:hypothetical protein